MHPLTIEDLVNIKLYITQLLGDLFIFDNHILDSKLIFYIKGKMGSIPEDIALKIIEELTQDNYVSNQIDVMGFGNSVVVIGMGGP